MKLASSVFIDYAYLKLVEPYQPGLITVRHADPMLTFCDLYLPLPTVQPSPCPSSLDMKSSAESIPIAAKRSDVSTGFFKPLA